MIYEVCTKETINGVKGEVKILKIEQKPQVTGNGENEHSFCNEYSFTPYMN
jgi:hypothetical protein